jgi:serine/threonine protein kinase
MNQPTSLADGRYLLVKQLGEGGMATVYRAYDQRLQVWRAVKILSPEFADKKKIAKRFEAEAQTMALLEHRNIVRVYDVGRDGADIAYIIMELVEGGCLVDWLESNGAMPPRMAVAAVMEICEGLQAAHDKGVIHRDIKPHNVLVTLDGVCRVTDFGIARVSDSTASQTKTGSVMGTWGYMAPEQRTDAKNVDERADVYATGATLYSLLTDRMPMDLFAADRNSSILDGVHELIVPILIKSTEYDRGDRHASMMELHAELKAIHDQLPPIEEGVEPLALVSGEAVAPPDPTVFRPATEARNLRTTDHFDLSDATLLPGDLKNMAGPDRTPTLMPEGDETLLQEEERAMPAMHGLTLPPEEVAVTEPGSITRQNRPVYAPASGANAPTVLHGTAATGAPIPGRAMAPQTQGGQGSGNSIALLFGGASLLVAVVALLLVVFLVLRPPPASTGVVVTPPVQPTVPGPAPVVAAVDPKPADPAPVEPVAPDPAPTAPTPDPPPRPDPVPTRPDPVPVAPDPVPAAPRPDPVPEPVAAVMPDPVPEPAPARPSKTDCVKAPVVTMNSGGNKVLFKVQPCDGNPADYENRVVVHYRTPGGGYVQHELPARGANWVWGLPVTDAHREKGVEYYIDGWMGSYGTSSSPRSIQP